MTTTRLFRNAAIGLAFSGLLAVSACGGDDDSSSDTTEAASATTAAGGADTDDTATDDTATDDTATEDSVVADTDDVEALSAEDCANLQEKYTDLVGGTAEPDFSKLDDLYGELEDEVPDNLKGDVQTIRAQFQPLLELLEKYDFDFAKAAADPEFAELSIGMETPEVQEATQRLDAYFQNCEEPAE